MYFQTLKTTLISLMALTALTGCGGSSSSSSSQAPQNTGNVTNKTIQTALTASSSYADLFNKLNTQADKTGLLIDAYGVQGLNVDCGTQKVVTDKDGLFTCNGTPLNFYLGSFKVGTIAKVPKDRIIYTQDILNVPRAATTHPDVTKLSMILQSLDEDADLSNGIELSQKSINLLDNELANFTTIHQLTLNDTYNIIDNVIAARKADNADVKLKKVSQKEAQINLTEALSNTPSDSVDMRKFNSISL